VMVSRSGARRTAELEMSQFGAADLFTLRLTSAAHILWPSDDGLYHQQCYR
jgi:hypothetical protein